MRVKINDKEVFSLNLNKMIPGLSIKDSKGISIDSRQVQHGDIFIAFKGENTDGHNYIDQAYKAGALLAIVEKNIDHKMLTFRVPSSKVFLNELASRYREAFNYTFIGITGSNGKTTTKELLVHILSKSLNTAFTKGNYNSTLGAPLSLFECCRENDIAVIEMGASKPGEIKYISDIVKPQMGLITNISGAHLENFRTIEEIAVTKGALFSSLPANGTAFINIDDSYIEKIPKSSTSITYSFEKDSDYSGQYSSNDGELTINNLDIKLKHPSKTMAENALAAFAIASKVGIDRNEIKESIESFRLTEGRGNILIDSGITIINDSYNSNLESAKKGIENLTNSFQENRKIVVIGDMLELGSYEREHHLLLGEYLLDKNINAVFTYGKLTRHTIKVLNKSSLKNKHYEEKKSLITDLKAFLKNGDVIYLKGSRGMKMEDILEGIKK